MLHEICIVYMTGEQDCGFAAGRTAGLVCLQRASRAITFSKADNVARLQMQRAARLHLQSYWQISLTKRVMQGKQGGTSQTSPTKRSRRGRVATTRSSLVMAAGRLVGSATSKLMHTSCITHHPDVTCDNEHLIDYPTPSTLNYMWSFGRLAGLCLTLQIGTGIFLGYMPTFPANAVPTLHSCVLKYSMRATYLCSVSCSS